MTYIKIPYDTLMKMPVDRRKFLIERHNAEQAQLAAEMDQKDNKGSTIQGEALNAYAKNTQEFEKNSKMRH